MFSHEDLSRKHYAPTPQIIKPFSCDEMKGGENCGLVSVSILYHILGGLIVIGMPNRAAP